MTVLCRGHQLRLKGHGIKYVVNQILTIFYLRFFPFPARDAAAPGGTRGGGGRTPEKVEIHPRKSEVPAKLESDKDKAEGSMEYTDAGAEAEECIGKQAMRNDAEQTGVNEWGERASRA
ncbi:UNVERIFIED_CONTAM: hypothetical protein PYX00_006854 [Menopon gallinae]|uniref:Uncharacterized protein n=1 Tax=Menopon gallinae TaxID=328185 RepID=A0AAW2HY08_9NEOP